MRDFVFFFLNGKPVEVRREAAGQMLSDFLRDERRLVGTKVVCAEGDCGACSVLRRFPLGASRKGFEAVNSCITTLAQMDGSSLVTVEALSEDGLSPIQDAMVKCHASQCGFCTPGFVMALSGLVESKLGKGAEKIVEKDAKNALTGNLCRCTGYQPILDAAASINVKSCSPLAPRFYNTAIQKKLKAIVADPIEIKTERFSFFAPTSAKAASTALGRLSKARILGAGTDLGVLVSKNKLRYENLMSLHLIPDLYTNKKKGNRLAVGSRVTLAELRRLAKKSIPELARFLDLFASPQIKNVATLAGNLVNASPIADTPPFLLVAGTVIHVHGAKGPRSIPIEKFFLEYRKTALKPGEWVKEIEFDIPAENEILTLKKVSQRKDLDISCVNAAFRLLPQSKEVRLALGGVASVPVRLYKTEAFLKKHSLNPEAFPSALKFAQDEIEPLSDLRGTAAFRRILVENLLQQFLGDIPR